MTCRSPIKQFPDAQRKRTAAGLLRLKQGFIIEELAQKRVEGNLLLATWNLREFGGSKSGGRDKITCRFGSSLKPISETIIWKKSRAKAAATWL
ncbi:MAG: hypothetical protein ABR514_05265 [Chthoniobacterales bacterium]